MNSPEKNTVNGKLQYRDRWYQVINAPLDHDILQKLETYHGDKKWTDPLAPWKEKPLVWILEDGKLYLEQLYINDLLEELTGSSKVFASWISELKLFIDDKVICKTYEQKGSYLNERNIIHLKFNKGVLISEEKETELYTQVETKNNIDRDSAYTTFHMNSNDLLVYIEDDMKDGEDQLLPLFSDLIMQMLDEDDEISLDMDDLKKVLSQGDDAFFVHVKGKDLDKMIHSVVSSVTDENILYPKGCLLHLTMNKKFSRKSVIKIIENIDEGLKFNYEPLEPDMKAPFYAGTRFVHGLPEDEVVIKILVSI